MKFLITFYATFIILSFILVLIEGSNEMFGYLAWFHLINIAFGSLGWVLINTLLKSSSIYFLIIKFFAGLLVINLMMVFLDGKSPSLTLIGLGNKYANFWVSLFLHLLYLISFLIASFPDIKILYRKNNQL